VAVVLVIDDSLQLRRMVRLTAEIRGHRVLEAEDGVVGWRKMLEERPDVVILDVMMPGPSGLDVCRAMRTDPRLTAIPVIVLTAGGLDEDEAEALAAGASAFLKKPFLPSILLATMTSLLDGETASGL